MHSPVVKYIHGIGINPARLSQPDAQVDIRKELRLHKDAFLCISVGELNENKNHQVVIKALGQLKDPDIHYIICGKGDQLENLTTLAKAQGVENKCSFPWISYGCAGYLQSVRYFCLPVTSGRITDSTA